MKRVSYYTQEIFYWWWITHYAEELVPIGATSARACFLRYLAIGECFCSAWTALHSWLSFKGLSDRGNIVSLSERISVFADMVDRPWRFPCKMLQPASVRQVMKATRNNLCRAKYGPISEPLNARTFFCNRSGDFLSQNHGFKNVCLCWTWSRRACSFRPPCGLVATSKQRRSFSLRTAPICATQHHACRSLWELNLSHLPASGAFHWCEHQSAVKVFAIWFGRVQMPGNFSVGSSVHWA